jgi:hypothetical protein
MSLVTYDINIIGLVLWDRRILIIIIIIIIKLTQVAKNQFGFATAIL